MGENCDKLLAVLRQELAPYCGENPAGNVTKNAAGNAAGNAAFNVTFIVGFSGGRDSLGLLWGLNELAQSDWQGRVRLLAAHFNHKLRGAESLADEQFCREFCQERGIEYVAQVARDLAPDMANLEQRARDERYRWFAELRREVELGGGHCYLLTAHHLEDQAETVLLHLLRGAGTTGLAAMREQSGWQLRPLLGVPRAVPEGALLELGLSWREDASNECLDYTRNFLRGRVLPLLREVNPQADRALSQVAQIAAAEDDYFAELVAERLRGLEPTDGGLCYPWDELCAEPPAVRRRLVRAMWCRLTERAMCPLSLAHVDSVLGLPPGGALHLSGAVLVKRRRGGLIWQLPSAEELENRRRKSRKGQK